MRKILKYCLRCAHYTTFQTGRRCQGRWCPDNVCLPTKNLGSQWLMIPCRQRSVMLVLTSRQRIALTHQCCPNQNLNTSGYEPQGYLSPRTLCEDQYVENVPSNFRKSEFPYWAYIRRCVLADKHGNTPCPTAKCCHAAFRRNTILRSVMRHRGHWRACCDSACKSGQSFPQQCPNSPENYQRSSLN